MCGIGGIIKLNRKKIDENEEKFAKSLMVQLQKRGTDAFGFYTFPSDVLFKIPMSVDEWRKAGSSFSIIGEEAFFVHTRATTVGNKYNNYNNHPFIAENNKFKIILAHNGGINNHEYLKRKYNFKYKEETDSAIIPNLLLYYLTLGDSLEEAWKKVYNDISGGFAIFAIIIDKKTGNEKYLFAANVNPFHYYLNEDYFIFASEEDMLKKSAEKYLNINLNKVKSLNYEYLIIDNRDIKTGYNHVSSYYNRQTTNRQSNYRPTTNVIIDGLSIKSQRNIKIYELNRIFNSLFRRFEMPIKVIWGRGLDGILEYQIEFKLKDKLESYEEKELHKIISKNLKHLRNLHSRATTIESKSHNDWDYKVTYIFESEDRYREALDVLRKILFEYLDLESLDSVLGTLGFDIGVIYLYEGGIKLLIMPLEGVENEARFQRLKVLLRSYGYSLSNKNTFKQTIRNMEELEKFSNDMYEIIAELSFNDDYGVPIYT